MAAMYQHKRVGSSLPSVIHRMKESLELGDYYELLAQSLGSAEAEVVLCQCLPDLLGLAETLDASERSSWLDLLRQILNAIDSLPLETACLACDLLVVWSDWPIVVYLADRLVRLRGEEIDYLRFCHALWHSGNTALALDVLSQARIRYPASIALLQLKEQLELWLEFCEQQLGIESICDQESGLSLVLLGGHHCSDYAWQYYDKEIAKRCCLPFFDSTRQWYEWLAQQHALDDQITFAIVHPDAGFVGVVSLILHDGVGFCYYWLGKDYRGMGLAGNAVKLLLGSAKEYWGMHTCYAKVYRDNCDSRHLLERRGFVYLSYIENTEDPEEIFYRQGLPLTQEKTSRELTTLFTNMQSDITIACVPGGNYVS